LAFITVSRVGRAGLERHRVGRTFPLVGVFSPLAGLKRSETGVPERPRMFILGGVTAADLAPT